MPRPGLFIDGGCGRLQLIVAAWDLGFAAGGVENDSDRVADFEAIVGPLWRKDSVRVLGKELCMKPMDLREYLEARKEPELPGSDDEEQAALESDSRLALAGFKVRADTDDQ